MKYGKGFGDSLFQTKSETSYGVHVVKRSRLNKAYERGKFSRMMSTSTVVHPQRLSTMLYGSVQRTQKFGKLFRVLSFGKHTTLHLLGTWSSLYIWKEKIWRWWQWWCGQYGIEGINSQLGWRISLSHRWSLKPCKLFQTSSNSISHSDLIRMMLDTHRFSLSGLHLQRTTSKSIVIGLRFLN